MNQRHTLSVLVENCPGVLMRVAALFGRRGYNIESLAVGVTENPAFSRITVVATGDTQVLEQVTRQLDKMINVVSICDLTAGDSIDRELALIKVSADPSSRAEIVQIVDVFRAKIVDMSKCSMVIEITGGEQKIDALLTLLQAFGILEVVRTGKIALARGMRSLTHNSNAKGDGEDGKSVLRSGCGLRAIIG